MKTIARLLLLAAICALVFSTTLLAQDASGERYVVILKQHAGPAPDVSKLGGRIEFRQDEEIVVTLPAGAIERLRQDPLVKYAQRVERPGAAPEPYLVGTPEEPHPSDDRFVTTAARAPLRPQPTAGPWDSGSYSYDGAGNITTIGSQTFAYDGAQRLVRAIVNGTDNYAYDGFGNMTSKSVGGVAQSMPTVNHSTNQLQTTGYTYDVAGNLLSDGAWSFTYDSFNQPLSKTYGGTNQNQEYYIYTAGDERIGEQENGWWIWSIRDEGGKVLRQYRSSATDATVPALWLEDFVWRDGLLLGSERATELGGRRHFHLDHLGTPRLITSDSAQLVSQHDYYPFGEELTAIVQEGPGGGGFDREEPMKFTGHERDFAAGEGREDSHYIDYMHARYYSPMFARFITADPPLGRADAPQSWNRYAYVENTPLGSVDPDGLEEIDVICGCPDDDQPDPAEKDREFHLWILDNDIQHRIQSGIFSALAYGARRAKPYVYNGAQIAALFLPGLEEFAAPEAMELGDELVSAVENPELREAIGELFQASDELSGGTAGAVRNELRTSLPTKGVFHWRKAYQRSREIMKLIRKGQLNATDLRMARAVLYDLRNALMGR